MKQPVDREFVVIVKAFPFNVKLYLQMMGEALCQLHRKVSGPTNAVDPCHERERMVTAFCARKTGRFSFSLSPTLNHRSSLYDFHIFIVLLNI